MSKKTKILYVTDGLVSGGKERQLVEIIKSIDRERFEIGVLTFNNHQHYTSFVKNNVDFFKVIPKKNKIAPFLKVRHVFNSFCPDIVHTWDLLADIYCYIPLRCGKAIYINGSIRDAGIEKGWQRSMKKFFLKRAVVVISNSQAGLKAYNTEGEVIHNIVNAERFLKAHCEPEFNIIKVASFTDYKDHITFIKAGIRLVNENVVNKVYLLGEGANRSKIMDLVPKEIAHRFIFTGTVRNVEEFLSLCKVGVLCSTPEFSEGLSNSVLEYLGAGLVPVVTDIGGSNEIINEENGFLIKAADHVAIYRIIKELQSNNKLLNSKREAALRTIDSKFSGKENIAKIEMLYQNLTL